LPQLVLALALVAAGALLVVAAIRGWSTHTTDCDNEAGTCLRRRQQLAIDAFSLLYAFAAIVAVAVAFRIVRSREVTALQVAVLGVALGLLALFLALDPVEHLDNRHTGWLSAALLSQRARQREPG